MWVSTVVIVENFFGGFADDKNRDYQIESYKNVNILRQKIEKIVFTNKDYENMVIPGQSIIYRDPPYQEVTQYEEKFNHEWFFLWCEKIKSLGHSIFISEYSMPNNFKEIFSFKKRTPLSHGMSNKPITEKLFTL